MVILYPINVLIACEESQTVCKAFRERGFNAYSCDIQNCSGGHPEWHILSDVSSILYKRDLVFGQAKFKGLYFCTEDGKQHVIEGFWDLIIAHPPCTYLSKASACRLYSHSSLDLARLECGLAARKFFLSFLSLSSCHYIAVENPVPLKIFSLPAPSQKIQPFYFGEHWQKTTCLWLKNLPPLFSTGLVWDYGLWVNSSKHTFCGSSRSAKLRSKTFPGIARAMAEQWGDFILRERGLL